MHSVCMQARWTQAWRASGLTGTRDANGKAQGALGHHTAGEPCGNMGEHSMASQGSVQPWRPSPCAAVPARKAHPSSSGVRMHRQHSNARSCAAEAHLDDEVQVATRVRGGGGRVRPHHCLCSHILRLLLDQAPAELCTRTQARTHAHTGTHRGELARLKMRIHCTRGHLPCIHHTQGHLPCS